jgi:hypothetical protein
MAYTARNLPMSVQACGPLSGVYHETYFSLDTIVSVNQRLFLVAFLFGEAQAAAFDCKSPNLSEVETTICKDLK